MMNALTIHQPFAELILRGEKRVENRGWRPTEPGTILIHAGKSEEHLTLNEKGTVDLRYGIAKAEMEFGKIIGMVEVVDVIPYTRKILPASVSRKYPWLLTHKHATGPYCWILENPVRFQTPILCRGNQGLWPYHGPLPPECPQIFTEEH